MSTTHVISPTQEEMTDTHKLRDWRPWLFLISAIVIAADRFTKLWIIKNIPEGGFRQVIPHVFRLSHVLNEGAAFSLFNDSAPNPTRWWLLSLSVLSAIIVAVLILRTGRRFSAMGLGFALVLGGAIGNAWDRLQYKMVVDFLEVKIIHYSWPDFNVADSAIVVGGILIFLATLFTPQSEEN